MISFIACIFAIVKKIMPHFCDFSNIGFVQKLRNDERGVKNYGELGGESAENLGGGLKLRNNYGRGQNFALRTFWTKPNKEFDLLLI